MSANSATRLTKDLHQWCWVTFPRLRCVSTITSQGISKRIALSYALIRQEVTKDLKGGTAGIMVDVEEAVEDILEICCKMRTSKTLLAWASPRQTLHPP